MHSLLHSVILFLSATVIIVPLCKRLGLGSVLGYLISGVVLGPYGFSAFKGSDELSHIAEIGIVILLFIIGLELQPQKLWSLRKRIFGLGSAQLILTALLVTGVSLFVFGNPSQSALMGLALAMSSTAISLQILQEKGRLRDDVGEASFSILLFQDLAVIPVLALVPLLAGSSTSGSTLTYAPLLIIAVILVAKYLLRPVFRYIASMNLREIFTAFALLLVIGTAYAMTLVGLSMALGAFLAGVMLANSEYRHELEIDLEPFKGLLLGLFFLSVGLSIQVPLITEQPWVLLTGVALLIIIKTLVIIAIGKINRLSWSDALWMGLLLSQGGEFAFVVFKLAGDFSLLSLEQSQILNLIVTLSMASTPLLLLASNIITSRLFNRSTRKSYDSVEDQSPTVIIGGYGRFGQITGRILHARQIQVTVIDHDPNQIELVRKFGWKAFYGDISRIDLLEAAGAKSARILVLAIDNAEDILKTIEICKHHFPHLKIVARASNRPEAFTLINKGIDVYREVFGSSLDMAEGVLNHLGHHPYEAKQIITRFKKYDIHNLKFQAKFHDDEHTLISMAQTSRLELIRLMQEDETKLSNKSTSSWGTLPK